MCMPSYLDNLSIFPSAIIKRGRDYFQEGRVISLNHDGNRVAAIVEGSDEEYEVTLTFGKDGYTLLKGGCTCPYYDDCKHMVAVLYALEEERAHSTPKNLPLNSKEYLLASLEEWKRGEDRRGRYEHLIRELRALLKDTDVLDKGELLVRSFVDIEYGLYLRSRMSDFYYATFSFYELLPLANETNESFIKKVFDRVMAEKLPIKNDLFKTFLMTSNVHSCAASYFLEVYQKDVKMASMMIENINSPLNESFDWDLDFLKIVANLRPKLLGEKQIALLFEDPKVLEDKNLLLGLLCSEAKRMEKSPSFYLCLEKTLPKLDRKDIDELFKSCFASGIHEDDAFFFIGRLPKEDLASAFSRITVLKYHPLYSTLAFYCYPAFGEYSLKELHPYYLWRIRAFLNEDEKEIALKASHLFLEKKRFANHDSDVYAAFYWLADFHVMGVLSMMNEKRFANYFDSNNTLNKAFILYLQSALLSSSDHPFILYKGEPHVSL